MFYIGIDYKDMIDSLTSEQLWVLHSKLELNKASLPPSIKELHKLTSARVALYNQQEIGALVQSTIFRFGIEIDCPF
jgi:hypothetical protein